MATYKLGDGSFIDGPDKPNAEQSAWLQSQGGVAKGSPSVMKDVAKQGLTGLVEGAVRAPFIGADLLHLAGKGIEGTWPGLLPPAMKPSAEVPSSWALNKLIKTTGIEPPAAETTAGKYANSIGNGIGGSVLGLGPGAFVANGAKSMIAKLLTNPAMQNAAIGGVSGGMGELAGQASAGFDPQQEQSGVARAVGSLAPVLAAAVGRHVTAPTYDKSIYQAGKDLTPQDFVKAQARAAELKAAGADSATLTDTLPLTSPLRPITQQIAATPGGSEVYHKIAGRTEGNIKTLLTDAKNDAQGAAVPGYTGSLTGNERDVAIANMARQNRTGALRNELQGAGPIDEQQLSAVVKALQQRASNVANAGTDDALYAASGAGAVKGMPPLPGTGKPPMQLPPNDPYASLRGAGFQGELPPVPMAPVKAGVPAQYNLEALSKKVKSLEMQGAMAGGEGPAGAVLKNAAAVQASKTADTALKGISPEYDAAMAAYKTKSPHVDVARIFEENKLQPQAGAQSSTLQSDIVREQLSKALAKINPQVEKNVSAKISAADTLDQLHPVAGMTDTQQAFGNTAASIAVSPHQGLKNWLKTRGRDAANKEVGHILANPTAENYQLLKAMVARDPSLGRYLQDFAGMGSANSVTQTKGSQP